MTLLNEKELVLVQELREQISDLDIPDERTTDWHLVRWLRARDLDVDLAEDMIRKATQWREENGTDKILKWEYPAYLEKNFPCEIVGKDKDGCPILVNTFRNMDCEVFKQNFIQILKVIPVGKWNLSEAVSCGENLLFIKYCIKMLETLFDLMDHQKSSTPITQFLIIYDFEDFTVKQMTSLQCIETILDGAAVFDLLFPETLKACYCVNVPKAFTVLYGIVKPMLTERTLAKLEIYGINSTKWKNAFFKRIPSNQLPPKYGGTNISCVKEFLYGIQIDDEENDDLVYVTVEAGKKLEIAKEVNEANSFMSWTFGTDDFDIGFKILYENDEEVVEFQKVNSHQDTLNGSLICEKAGTYTVVFDNSYSLLRSKKLHYIISLNTPTEILALSTRD